MAITNRVRNLRERIVRAMPEVCLERALLMTESYKATEGQPEIIRRARALENILAGMSIGIDDEELLVGKLTSKLRGAAILPEIQWDWYLAEMDTFSTRTWDRIAPLSEEDKAKMQEFLPYWKGKSLYERWHATCPEEAAKIANVLSASSGFGLSNHHFAHMGIEGQRVLSLGLSGIRAEVDAGIAKLNPAFSKDFEKLLFFKAVKITLDSVSAFAQRYAALARSMAADQQDARRRAELENIAETCALIPENPARTFHQALQSLWFVYAALMIEGWGNGIGLGRADQYLYPLYKQDIEAGRITREQAQELVELFYIKFNGAVVLQGSERVKAFAGFPIWANITLGGITRDGKDAVNDLTYLFIDAEEAVALMSEDLMIRIHRNNPDSYVMRAVEALKVLRGKFKFSGDEMTIQQLVRDGKPLERARDYVMTGCVSPSVPGFSQDLPSGPENMPLFLELALNNGVYPLTGEQLGPKTGDPRQFTSFDQVFNAFKTQLKTLLPVIVMNRDIDMKHFGEYCPAPFQSALFPPCITNGTDITRGGLAPYSSHAILFCGAPNVADSLAAIKKVVFDDQHFSMDRLITALVYNFEGEQELLHALEGCPKFGNDDDYVDSIMHDLWEFCCDEVSQYEAFPGGVSNTGALCVTAHIPLGAAVGALPEGRKAGMPFADGGLSPVQGKNVSGPTATLRSVAKVDHAKLSGGCVLNMRFNPDALKDAAATRKFATLVRTFFETGGSFVQFNIVDTETLKAAQRNPTAYRDLLVRVSTYSAYFVELSPEMQNDIIARLEIQQA